MTDDASPLRQLAHDLRSPLNAVLGFAALLEADLDGEAARDAGRIREAAEQMTAVLDAALDAGPAPSPAGPVPSAGVLLVEDHPANVALVERILCHRPAVTLRSVSTVDGAVAALAGGPVPDLVLLDLNLQGPGGRELLDRLPPSGAARPTVVVVSADPVAARAEAERPGGADGFLAKPYSVGELLALVDRYCPAATGSSTSSRR